MAVFETHVFLRQTVRQVLFGIVGGLGPMATVDFARSIVDSRVRLYRAMTQGVDELAQAASSSSSPAAQTATSLVLSDEERRRKRKILVENVSTMSWSDNEIDHVLSHQSSPLKLHDQDHIPILIAQATTVPPRPSFILGHSTVDPTPAMVDVARGLINAGATHLAVVCNTAHYFWGQVAKQLQDRDIVFVDMIELSVQCALRWLLPAPTSNVVTQPVVGLLATAATLKIGIYQDIAKRHQVKILSPLDLHQGQQAQDSVHEVIFGNRGIKSGFDSVETNPDGMRALLNVCLALQVEKHISVIILGCTELPLLLTNDSVQKWAETLMPEHAEALQQIRFIDPNSVLSDYVLKQTLLSRE